MDANFPALLKASSSVSMANHASEFWKDSAFTANSAIFTRTGSCHLLARSKLRFMARRSLSKTAISELFCTDGLKAGILFVVCLLVQLTEVLGNKDTHGKNAEL